MGTGGVRGGSDAWSVTFASVQMQPRQLSAAPSLPSPRFVTLDAMRGCAALVVMVYHGSAHLCQMGYAAVDFFFLLSGFVLAHRYGNTLAQPGHVRAFLFARCVRLYPLYVLGSLIGLAAVIQLLPLGLQGWNMSVLPKAVVCAVLFLPLMINGPLGVFPLNGPAWSLFFEWVVNVFYAVLARRRLWPWIMVVVFVLPLLWALRRWYAGGGATAEEFMGGFPRVFFSFFLGVVVYRNRPPSSRQVPAAISVLLIAVLVTLYNVVPLAPLHWNVLLVVVMHPLLVWVGSVSPVPQRCAPFLKWLGDISYALYATHVPMMILVALVLKDHTTLATYLGIEQPGTAVASTWDGRSFYVALPLAVLVAHIATFRYDPPARRWIGRWVSKLGRYARSDAAQST